MESQHPSPDYIVTSKGSSLRYELVDPVQAQENPLYWLGVMQPEIQPDIHSLDEQQIRREFHMIIDHIRNTRDVTSEELVSVQQIMQGELLDETHVKWNLSFANEVYEHEFSEKGAESVKTLDKESVQQWVFDSAMNLAINRLSADDLREFGLTEEQIEGTTTVQKTSLPDVLLMANAWDNTDRDPALLFMLEKMISKLHPEQQELNNLFLDTALATGKRFIQEDHNQFDTSHLDSAYGVQNGKVSMLVDDKAA